MKTMENKQTTIDWIKSQLENYGDPKFCILTWDELDNLLLQAKQMEKEQIIKAWKYGVGEFDITAEKYAERYYNENYGKGN